MSLIDNEKSFSSSLMNKLYDFDIIIKIIFFIAKPITSHRKQTDHLRESLKHENNTNKLIR